MILIITNKEDAHPTPVIERLSARGVPVFRLNTESAGRLMPSVKLLSGFVAG